jgi:hypothetical protein
MSAAIPFEYNYDMHVLQRLPAHAQGSPQAALQGCPQAGTRWPHGWSHTSREQGATPHFRPHFRWAHRHTHFSRQEDRGDSPHRPLLVPWGQLQKKPMLGIRPYVLGSARSASGLVSHNYGSGSGSFHHQADIFNGVPGPDPDPYVFEHPGTPSGSVSQRYGSKDTDPHPKCHRSQHWKKYYDAESLMSYFMTTVRNFLASDVWL